MTKETETIFKSDEIDFLGIIKKTIEYRKTFMVFLLMGVIFAALCHISMEKKYQVSTTFFIPPTNSSSGGGSSASSLLGYAKLFGVSGPSNIDAIIKGLIKSKRIQIEVAKNLLPEFTTLINEKHKLKQIKTVNDKINLVRNELKLYNLTFNQALDSKMFTLYYQYKNPKIAYEVLINYLTILEELNEELEISPNKSIISVLDYPTIPTRSNWPNKKINLLLGLFVSCILFYTYLFITTFIKKNKKILRSR